jgi:hypothetical protein
VPKPPAHINIVIVTILLLVAGQTGAYVRRPITKQSWKVGVATVTLGIDGTLNVSGEFRIGTCRLDPPPWHSVASTITGLVIEEGATYIAGWDFFPNRFSQSNIILQYSATIDLWIFGDCDSLRSVTIPSSVAAIQLSQFLVFKELESITVAADNAHYSSEDGILFNKDKTALLLYPHGRKGAYTIPSSVTTIVDSAFRYCTGLTSVTIPGSVKSIGVDAFYGCSNVTSVTIENGVKFIGAGAFSLCRRLTSVTIPDGVTSIGDGAFYECTGLTSVTIPSSVMFLGGAFYGCSSLTSITIPNSVKSIGIGAFSGCKSLTSVIIPDSVRTIGAGAFAYCTGLTSITIPKNVTHIGRFAFRHCASLTSVMIESGVKSIGTLTFANCTSLTSIIIPSTVTTIGEDAFLACVGLTSITVQNSIPPDAKVDIFYDISQDNVCLYVPANSIAAYRASNVWNRFYCIKPIVSTEVGIHWFAMSIMTTLILSATVFVIIKKVRKSIEPS